MKDNFKANVIFKGEKQNVFPLSWEEGSDVYSYSFYATLYWRFSQYNIARKKKLRQTD